MNRHLTIYTDGACRGNPGEAGIGIVVMENDAVLKEISHPIGTATNNIAEYTALSLALQEAHVLKADSLKIFSDSELMVQQIRGLYKVKHANIIPLFEQCKQGAAKFKHFEIDLIPREKNKRADVLAKNAIYPKQAKAVASPPKGGGEESPSSKG